MRRDIEEHFERCIHALEARQHILLSQLDQFIQHQGMLQSSFTLPLINDVVQSN